MSLGNGVPQVVWESQATDQEKTLPVGCPNCLFEGVEESLARVYFWGGTSLCARHIKALQGNA